MKYIEIKEGLSIQRKQIESIQRHETSGGSIITMESGVQHETAFQYIQLLQLLEVEETLKGVGSRLEGQFHNG
jgi:hypothetical protein